MKKFAFSGFRLGSLQLEFLTEGSSEQSQGVSEASPHWTEASPVSITAPKAIGIWMQRLWVTVKCAGGFAARTPGTGVDDRIATADCSGGSGCANLGETVTGTQTVSSGKRRFTGFCGTAGKVRIWSGREVVLTAAEKDRD